MFINKEPRSLFGLSGIKHPIILLTAAAAIPVLMFAAWTAYQNADGQRSLALLKAQDTVDRVGERITAVMITQVQVAEALALSHALDSPDLPAFHLEAERLRVAHPLWYTVELDDLQGMQIVNILRPVGDPLGPTADRESFEQVLRDKMAVIGGIGPLGSVSGRHLLAIRVPVVRSGMLRFILTIAMAPDAVGEVLRKAGLPAGWIGAVADHHGNLVARSLSEQDTIGHSAAPTLHEAIGRSSGGFYKGRTLEGVPVDTVFRTLSDAGRWSVHLGIPSDALDWPVRRAVYAVVAGMLVSLAIAVALTIIVARSFATQREQDEQRSAAALSASEERADLAVEAAALGTWAYDVKQDRITGSERCRSLLGLPYRSGQEAVWPSAGFLATVHPDDRKRVRDGIRDCLRSDKPFEDDFRVLDQDGSPRWRRVQGRSTLSNQNHITLYGIIADIDARKHAETERLQLLRRLATAQEDVQRRIAHDLHDQVGQTVTGLSLGLKGLEHAVERLIGHAVGDAPMLKDQIRWLQGLTSEIGRDIHQASADLRPTALDDLGLPRALGALIADWSERYGIMADVQIVGAEEPRLPEEIETVLYRVVQEALTNVLKHAQAKNVSVVFERRLATIHVVIEDDGIGFGTDEPGCETVKGERKRLGLSGMRERLAFVQGDLRVESSGAGTTLFVTIELDRSSAHSETP